MQKLEAKLVMTEPHTAVVVLKLCGSELTPERYWNLMNTWFESTACPSLVKFMDLNGHPIGTFFMTPEGF